MSIDEQTFSPPSQRILLACAFLCVAFSARGENTADRLASLAEEIQMLEKQVVDDAGVRWRIRHAAEYGNPDIMPMREATKQAEKELLEAREKLQLRYRVTYPAIQEMQKSLNTLYDELRAARQMLDAIEREISMAEGSDRLQQAVPGSIEELRTDRAEGIQQVESLEDRIREQTVRIRDVVATAKRDDVGLANLADEVVQLEQKHGELLREMNLRIDELPEVRAYEQERVKVMTRLHELRARERELREALAAGNPPP